MTWRANPGYLPPEASGKSVRVRLEHERAQGRPAANRIWPADGRGACCWTKRGSKFDIAEYEVLS